jgi:hypothetical protein
LATIGTIAFGNDTESDRISVRTAVDADSPGSRFPSEHETSIYLSHSATLLDLIIANSSSRRAYATPCYSLQRPTSSHANLQPQRTCFCPRIATPPLLVTNPSLPTARQFQPAPPITGNQPPERQDRTDSTRFPQRTCSDSCIYTPSLLATRSSLPSALQLQSAPPIASSRPHARPHRTDSSGAPASPRPAAPPTCRPNCPGRLAWTQPVLCHAAQRLHASKSCHAGSHGTLQKYHLEENSNKKSPIWRCNNAFEEPDGYACASASCMAPALPSRPSLRTSSRPSSRAPSRAFPGASAVHQQTAPPLARAGLKTAINVLHA